MSVVLASHQSKECIACHVVFTALKDAIDNRLTINSGEDLIIRVCSVFESLQFCEGLIKTYGEAYVGAIAQRYLNPERACSKLGACPVPQYLLENLTAYEIEVMSDMPTIEQWPVTGDDTFMVLQVTDIHADFYYIPGSDSECDGVLCCRSGTGKAGY